MYWPLGAPRIYVPNKRRRKIDVATDGEAESEGSDETSHNAPIIGLRVSRNGHLFATISATSLSIWQASPVIILTSVTRSIQSLRSYGENVAVQLRPDSSVAVVQTSAGYLVTYSILTDQNVRVYQQLREEGGHHQKLSNVELMLAEEEKRGVPEVTVRFRMVIKVDAGISNAIALDEELVVATEKPPAVQCIKWTKDESRSQTSTELVSRMTWMQQKSMVKKMVHDRAMSLAVWIMADGRAYAVQRLDPQSQDAAAARRLFRGSCFHKPESEKSRATIASINARFSLLAVACADAEILVYTAKDYQGNIPLSHRVEPPASSISTGDVTSLRFSPDGYCLFASYEKGWALWSVYGKLQGSSFAAERSISDTNDEGWLLGIDQFAWLDSGTSVLMMRKTDQRLWMLELAKNALTGCYCSANVARTILVTNTNLLIYRGYDLPSQTTISADASLWSHVQIPPSYLHFQRPIRSVVTSSDGRYIAIAGRRGLAHYSVASGRWKQFDDQRSENSFVVRGGMCWYQHLLIVAAETDDYHELRLYSRERGLNDASLLYVEHLPSSVVTMSLTAPDSLLVYTYRNILYHFVINASTNAVSLKQVGQIALNGIVRAPARVRAVSWILPEHQLRDGDPSQDVACASIVFLVDAKLVLLQSSASEDGEMKYDMRVIANNVEYFDLMRDQQLSSSQTRSLPPSPSPESALDFPNADRGLKDSLWYFDGRAMHCWMDVEELVQSASTENQRELPPAVEIVTDFYPTSIVLDKGLLLGLDADLAQRRDVAFAYFRHSIRSQLFLPDTIRQHLANYDHSAASSLALRYQHLPYFSHALEMLLHKVLDDEVDRPEGFEGALLPSIVSFLSSFPDYLDIIVQCTRKTEVRSWKTLFGNLPPPRELFEASLQKDMLKTAGGYLIVMQTLEEDGHSPQECARLLQRAKAAGDWELCKELARFLMALDPGGDSLKETMAKMTLGANGDEEDGVRLHVSGTNTTKGSSETLMGLNGVHNDDASTDGEDYHSAS